MRYQYDAKERTDGEYPAVLWASKADDIVQGDNRPIAMVKIPNRNVYQIVFNKEGEK